MLWVCLVGIGCFVLLGVCLVLLWFLFAVVCCGFAFLFGCFVS